MPKFTGRAKTVGVSLPVDMIAHLKARAKREDRSFSTLVKRAIEADIHAHAKAKRDADK